jgi:uncharacterized protein YlzI (FlbEa/FlbD family)
MAHSNISLKKITLALLLFEKYLSIELLHPIPDGNITLINGHTSSVGLTKPNEVFLYTTQII